MKMFRPTVTSILRTLVIASLGLVYVVGPRPASAATISVSPPRFELFGNPGDSLNEKIKINNPSDADATYQIEVEDFVAQGEEGGVDFKDPAENKTSFSLAKWISVEPTRFTVPAGKESILNYTIRIPKSGEPGGHYASVLVKLAGGSVSGTSGAAVQSRVGTLILLRVSGDVKETLAINRFSTDNNYYQNGPVNFQLSSTNNGNVHVAPSGTIVITNMFGQKVKELPLTQANVLPGATRNVRTVWDQKGMVGRYTATLVANYGQNKQTLSATTSFIVFPPYLMVIIVVVLLLLFFMTTQRKKLKRIINKLTSD